MLADWGPTLAIGGVALGAGALMLAAALAPKIARKKIPQKNQSSDSGPRPDDSAPRPRGSVPWAEAQAPRLPSDEPWLDGAEPWRQLDLWDQPARFLAAMLTGGYRGTMAWEDIMLLYWHWAKRQLAPGEKMVRESYMAERLLALGCRRSGRLKEVGSVASRKRMQFYDLPMVMTDGLPPAGAGALPAPGTGDAAEPQPSLKRRLTVMK